MIKSLKNKYLDLLRKIYRYRLTKQIIKSDYKKQVKILKENWLLQTTKKIMKHEIWFTYLVVMMFFSLCFLQPKFGYSATVIEKAELVTVCMIGKLAFTIISYCIKSYKETDKEEQIKLARDLKNIKKKEKQQ